MLRYISRFSFAAVPVLFAFACGGSAAPKANDASSGEAKPADSAAPASSAAPAKSANIEDQRESFVKSCLESTTSKEYCDCGFEQFKEIFKGTDLSKDLADDDPRLLQLKTQTQKACAGKLPESDIKADFMDGCAEKDARKNPYCECAWTSLRKKMAYTEFVSLDTDSPSFLEARKAMVVDCKGKYPVDIAKFDFMKACTHGQSAGEAPCLCKWDKLIKQFSAESIIAGTADIKSVKGFSECK